MYPLSKQPVFASVWSHLKKTDSDVADAFLELRNRISAMGALDRRTIELCMIAGFVASRNEGGFRVHCYRAVEHGAKPAEIEQAILLMLGSTQGLSPVVDALRWMNEELEGMREKGMI